MSGFNFSDAARRAMFNRALTNQQFMTVLLGSSFIKIKRIKAEQQGNTINYRVFNYTEGSQEFRTWGTEGGYTAQRLSSELRDNKILEIPQRIFITDDEIKLFELGQRGSLQMRVSDNLGMIAKRVRTIQLLDSIDKIIDTNEALSGYPSMQVDDGTHGLTYDNTYQTKAAFDTYDDFVGWVTHSDNKIYLEGLADTVPEPGTKRWVTKQGNQIYMHGIPVYFLPFSDFASKKDYSNYELAGLKYVVSTDPTVYGYRTYLMTKQAITQYIGWSPITKMVDVAPVPPGTSGYSANGQSSGVEWYGAMLLSNVIPIPRDNTDRLGLAQLLHKLN